MAFKGATAARRRRRRRHTRGCDVAWTRRHGTGTTKAFCSTTGGRER